MSSTHEAERKLIKSKGSFHYTESPYKKQPIQEKNY